MLELKDINKSFKIRDDKYQHVLKDLSATFPSHGFITLLGASGNGKTTVLNILGGLLAPDSGEVYFNDKKIEDFETFRRERVSFIFQDLNLIPHLSALDNVILGISDEWKNKKERATEILLSLGLEESLHKRPDQLSGGQQQRVAVARTIAKNVDIIICDEPTGSLDNKNKKVIADILKDLSKSKLVIYITHNLDLASEYSDMIYETVDGQIVDHSHLIKQGQFASNTKDHRYDSNVTWLAFKNIVGRYKHTIRYALFIIFIMLIASTAIVIQGEYVKKYIHDTSLDTGIKSIRVDMERPGSRQEFTKLIKAKDNVESMAYMYNTQIRVTGSRILQPPPLISTDLILMTDTNYFEEILAAGRLPEEDHEVMMTSSSVIRVLTKLGMGGQRLEDQFATGELDANEVFDIIDLSNFTVFEQNWPKIQVVGIIDDSRIYETGPTIYCIKGFTDLFEYTSSGRASYLELPKRLELNQIIIYKDNVYREEHDQLASELEADGFQTIQDHEKRVDATYNKIDSFFSLSVVFLYVIIAIASISFISLLSASIFDRKYEIGLYRTKGYTKLNIMKILGLEMYFLGFLSLIISVILLLIAAFVMYLRIDYINSFSHVLQIINIPVLAIALLGIITVFVFIIVYISNTLILRESVLSNIKDTGHTKKTIKKQVGIAFAALIIIGIAQFASNQLDLRTFFKSEATQYALDENRDDYSNVEKSGIFQTFTREDLVKDLDDLGRLLYQHTHLNTNYDTFLHAFDDAKEQVFDDMTKLEYMRLTKPIVATLNCVNSRITFSDDLDQVKVFADRIYFSNGKIYLADNTFYKHIPAGSEIVSINGRNTTLILEQVFSSISSEGENETYKQFVLNNDFALNYLIAVEYAENFDISYIGPDGNSASLTVPATEYKNIKASNTNEDLYACEFSDTYALLTMKSFSSLVGDYDKSIDFLDGFFRTLEEKDLDYLILDLRGNKSEGADVAAHLYSYLQHEPSLFFASDTMTIDLPENNFEGKLFILHDGGSGGVTGQLIALLDDKNIGYRIGQEASNTSLISSDVIHYNLVNSDLVLTIATDISNAATSDDNSGKPLMPDYTLIPSIEDMVDDKDIQLNLATHIVDRELAIDDFSELEPVGLLRPLTIKEMMSDLNNFRNLMSGHTHLHTDEVLMQELLDTAADKIFDSMTKLEFMRVLQPVAASMNAHNTKIVSDDGFGEIKVFADRIYAKDGKLYLSDNSFYTAIPLGSEITSINGRSSSEIIDSIFSCLSSDGQNETYKYYKLNENFGANYLKYVEYLDYFDILYTSPEGVEEAITVPGIEAQTVIRKSPTHEDPDLVSYTFNDDYAVLKVKAFSPSMEEGFDEFFGLFGEENLTYLILDIRGNAGGDYTVADYLLSYIVPNYPSKQDDAYDGELIVLQDGGVTSTAGQFLAMLKSQKAGTLIGDESASSSTISTSVESIVLENSGLIFDFSTAVSQMTISGETSDLPDDYTEFGITPDYQVTSAISDIIGENDAPLEYAKEMIEAKKFYGEFYNIRMEGIFKVHSKDQLTNDLNVIVETLRDQHTNLYTDKHLFSQLEESIRNELHDDMTKLEFIRLVSPLAASVNCLQTGISYSVVDQKAKSLGGAYSQDVFDSNLKVFADKIYVYDGKLYLLHNAFYGDVPVGSEILSINGRTSAEIIDIMFRSLPSDGDNDTLKYQMLNSDFSWYYFLYIENTDKFNLEYKTPDGSKASTIVHGELLNEIVKAYPGNYGPREPMTYEVLEDYAYLDINTFAVYDPIRQKNFRYALYDFFMEAKLAETENLILDLRGNYGGNPNLAAKLLTYLQPEPHKYWSERSAYDEELSEPLVTSTINYSGNLYVLIDGLSTSTTGHLASLLNYHDVATFIGQETGSSYMSSDNMENLKLTETNIHMIYSTEVFEVDAPGIEAGRGIQPDYEVVPTVDDLINGVDPVLEFTVGLIDGQ